MPHFEKATSAHIDELVQLYKACTKHLLAQEIMQWDDAYPTREHISYHINKGECIILVEEGAIVGSVVLNEWQTPEWELVHWKLTNPLVIHMLCVSPMSQNGGYGKRLLDYSEKVADMEGYHSIRLDSFSQNEKSLAFYEKNGYKKIGEITFANKAPEHNTYICFEKAI
jgi:ribosomal protein S18 acetylase RimI-like enzyme